MIHNELAFHASMPKSTDTATLEWVRTGGLRQKFNRRCLALLELPTVLWRSEHQPRGTFRIGLVGDRKNRKTMVMVSSGDLKQNVRSALPMNRRGRILAFLGCDFYDLRAGIPCRYRLGMRKRYRRPWRYRDQGGQQTARHERRHLASWLRRNMEIVIGDVVRCRFGTMREFCLEIHGASLHSRMFSARHARVRALPDL
jgi:hypothetical protein